MTYEYKRSPFVEMMVNIMEEIAPPCLAEPWDKVGLLVETPGKDVGIHKIMLTIDLTEDVVTECVEKGVSFVISYHPPMLKGIERLDMGRAMQRNIIRCIHNGISVYSPHTSLDSMVGGINDWILKGIYDSISPLIPKIEYGENVGSARIASVSGKSIKDISMDIAKTLSVEQYKVALGKGHTEDTVISRIAVCAGSGGSLIEQLRDTEMFITGEMSHHQILSLTQRGVSALIFEHTRTERKYLQDVLVELIRKKMQEKTCECPILVSEKDKCPIEYRHTKTTSIG